MKALKQLSFQSFLLAICRLRRPPNLCHIWIHSQNCGVRICDSRFWVKFHFSHDSYLAPTSSKFLGWASWALWLPNQELDQIFEKFSPLCRLSEADEINFHHFRQIYKKNHHIGWNKWWQNRHTNFHQNWWLFHHLNYHRFRQIPKKITLWGETKSDKIVTWIFTKYGDHTITLIITNSGRSPQKSP